MNSSETSLTSRRDFLKTSSTMALAGAIAAPHILSSARAASPGDTLKVGLIGCGGRGTGGAAQAMKADSNVELFAVGDVFEKATKGTIKAVAAEAGPDKVKVKPEHTFVGLDAYRKVIDSGVDVVILATPPGFRPAHFKACIEASKNVFMEKPVAIDAPVIMLGGAVRLERVTDGLQRPWSLAFTPEGDLLVTEKYRGIRVIREGRLLPEPLAGGPPDVFAQADSGLLDLALDPDFERNRMVYVSFAEGTAEANRTSVWRARYEAGRLHDGRVIFRAAPDKAGPGHPGGRMLFLPDGTLLLTVGDGYEHKVAAQDPASDRKSVV